MKKEKNVHLHSCKLNKILITPFMLTKSLIISGVGEGMRRQALSKIFDGGIKWFKNHFGCIYQN